MKTLLTISLLGALVLAGCAAQSAAPTAALADELPGISAYYNKATEHHIRSVRKPYRDQQRVAMRELARATDAVLAEARTWDSDARLVALAEPERDAQRAGVAEFRDALERLKAAAARSDVTGVEGSYARAIQSYRQISARVEATN
ncbi:MAG: hypothetical protein IPM13_03705 [Phycisphaerales bacterium]|nr:hypothetical protein [Phycisphaerales bacterium]